MATKSPVFKPSTFQQQSPKSRLEFPLTDFSGLNNVDDPSSVDDPESPDTLNTVLEAKGSIGPRKGYLSILTSALANGTLGGKEFYKSDGTKQLVFVSGTTLEKYNNAGGVTTLASGFTANVQWYFDTYNDRLYGVNSSDGLIRYDGTTVATIVTGLANPPQYFKIHKNRGWMVDSNSSTLRFSNAGDPETYPANNFISVNTNDGQVITGLEVLLDSLIVFKTDSIWIITGEPLGSGNTTVIGNLNLRRANSDVGCVAGRTICKVESYLLFMGRAGIYVFQNYQAQLISRSINGTFRNDMNPNFQFRSYAVYSPLEKKYLVGYADNTSTVPNKMICYDLLVKAYTIWDHINGGWAINYRFNQQDSVVVGDPSTGQIYQMFQGYADIAGANGFVGSATSTTLVDSSMSWATNQFAGARVQVGLGTALVSTAIVVSNTATTLTVASWGGAGTPTANAPYTIGGYNSYWASKIFDFGQPQLSKRFKYWNIFTDAEANYNLQVGLSMDFAPLTLGNQPPLSLSSGSYIWDQAAVFWDQAGVVWDTKASLFKRMGLPGSARFIQVIFGNFNANQPWRVFDYSLSYKLKKARPT